MMRWFWTFLLAVTALACSRKVSHSPQPPADPIQPLVDQLQNEAIEWDGSYDGLSPRVAQSPQGAIADALCRHGKKAQPALMRALDDPKKFAAAHVLLTWISELRYSGGPGEWNDLKVDLYGDGSVTYHPDEEQIRALQEKWREWLLLGDWDKYNNPEVVVGQLRNDMVKWHAGIAGYSPELNNDLARRVRFWKYAALLPLLEAVSDPNRYVAAHILLTDLSGVSYHTGPPRWNGLFVNLHGDGKVELDPADTKILRGRWLRWLTRGKPEETSNRLPP